jgi:hypothetical protein
MMATNGSGKLRKVSQSSGRLYARRCLSHHNPEGEERDQHRRPVLRRDAVEPGLRGSETVGIDQAAERRRQRDRKAISPVLHVGPGEQHFGARFLIVPATLDRGHLGRLIAVDIFATEVTEQKLRRHQHGG